MLRCSALRSFASLFVALLVLHGSAARAQSPAGRAVMVDSADIVRHARNIQRDFEWFRRINLPVEPERGAPTCDERVGRYCYWYEPTDEAWLQESKSIEQARERLLQELAADGEKLPGDDWIIGQRIRYLVEQGRADLAIAAAQKCQATRWWCDALEGFARHMAHDYEAAGHAFARALEGMPESTRCAWIDLTMLLGDGGRRYRKLSCTERQLVGERIWWLAHPLYSRPGNDLQTEHYARHTMALLLEDAATAEGVRWDNDTYELVMRFGWPTRWSRPFDRPGQREPPGITGHEPSPSFWLLPTPILTDDWADVTELRWNPTLERPPARYAPPYTRGFGPIDRAQFARFRRRDTTITVASFDLTPDPVLANRPVDVRLAVTPDAKTPATVKQASTENPRVVMTVHSPWRPAVVSLEAVGIDTPWVVRQRAMISPDPGGALPLISDILLFAPAEVLPESLEAVLPTAVSGAVIPVGEQVGLYWEMYDEPDSTLPVEITVTAMKARWKGDLPYPIGRPWCPVPPAKSIRLQWREEPGARPRGIARAVVLDLRSLSEGRYLVTIHVSLAGRSRGCSSRELRLVSD